VLPSCHRSVRLDLDDALENRLVLIGKRAINDFEVLVDMLHILCPVIGVHLDGICNGSWALALDSYSFMDLVADG
jgi:hypothetical protein